MSKIPILIISQSLIILLCLTQDNFTREDESAGRTEWVKLISSILYQISFKAKVLSGLLTRTKYNYYNFLQQT
jgi:hypothetical protein